MLRTRPQSAYEQAVNGYTKEERQIAEADLQKATCRYSGDSVDRRSDGDLCTGHSQVYQRNVEPGEYVSPGVPLVTLIDLGDMWVHFDLREDLVRTLKIGDRFDVLVPALSDRHITVEVRLIATKGEYASWRATRATGDFDLRTFEIRAYPVDNRTGAAAWHERLSRLASAQMKAKPKAGFLLVARREWRWLLHDRVARHPDLWRAAVRLSWFLRRSSATR